MFNQIGKNNYNFKNIEIKLLFSLVFSAFLVILFRTYCYAVLSGKLSDLIIKIPIYLFSIKTWFIIVLLSCVVFFYSMNYVTINGILFKYRFIIAFVVFILCVFFELTGSSIGMWCTVFGESDKDILLGVSRSIRSDEWAVFTPMGISQYYNYSGAFPYYSDTIRGCSTDVFFEYGQAVLDPLVIFRPFFWGYLFLPIAKGMAFFWCGRTITLFIVSFEFGMLITRKNKSLSLVWAFLITYAPVVQWWFAVNGLVEMLVYTQLSVLMLYHYMNEISLKKRFFYLFMIVICAGGYVLTFYPPWMIPLAYVLLALVIWCLLENYKNCKMQIIDWISVVISFFIFVSFMLYLYFKSKDTINSIMNTNYPGKRSFTGGGIFNFLFLYITNIWHSILGNGAWGNVCESSYFIDFFPVCWILPFIILIKEESEDILIKLLLVTSAFLGIFCVFGFPKIVAKVTCLSNCTPGRVLVMFGFCNLLLLIRTLSLKNLKFLSLSSAVISSIAICLIVFQGAKILNPNYLYQFKGMSFTTTVIFCLLYFCLFAYNKRQISIVWKLGTVCIVLFASLLVNPIRHGIQSVEEIAVLNTLKEVHDADPSSTWIIENGYPFSVNNTGLLVGVPTFNSTNVYPNLERWHIIDPDVKFADVYNRYSHISIRLEEVSYPAFEIHSADYFSCAMNISDLRKLRISYLMSNRDLSSYVLSGDLLYITSKNGYSFYKINKNDKEN